MADQGIDLVFNALSHPYRRYVLRYLNDHPTVSLDALANHVATRTYGMAVDAIPTEDITRVFIQLQHTHVPVLAEAGLVDYDRSKKTVARGDAAEQAVPLLALVDDEPVKPV